MKCVRRCLGVMRNGFTECNMNKTILTLIAVTLCLFSCAVVHRPTGNVGVDFLDFKTRNINNYTFLKKINVKGPLDVVASWNDGRFCLRIASNEILNQRDSQFPTTFSQKISFRLSSFFAGGTASIQISELDITRMEFASMPKEFFCRWGKNGLSVLPDGSVFLIKER